jgi:hypothetical protein
VVSSWYVSDSDLAHGKAIRNSLMWNQNPKNWKDVSGGHAEDIASAMLDERSRKGPSMRKGLVPSHAMSKEGIADLQRRINAAGYSPPLTVDGKYGKRTQAGEAWLRAGGYAAKEAAKQIAEKPVAGKPAAVPSAKEAQKAAEAATASLGPSLLGVPINLKSALSTAAGAAAGWFAGGPVGTVVGIPLGFLGSKLIPEKKP